MVEFMDILAVSLVGGPYLRDTVERVWYPKGKALRSYRVSRQVP